MRTILTLAWLVIAVGCTGNAPVQPSGSRLTPAELERARSLPTSADSVLTHEAREYFGQAGIAVEHGPGSPGRVVLYITGVATGPTQSLGGQITIPEQTAQSLSSDGWDFTLEDAASIGPPNGFSGEALNLPIARAELRADPDGLYVATYTFTGPDGDVIVTGAGRLTGGCVHIDAEGTVTRVADISTVPLCQQVLGSL